MTWLYDYFLDLVVYTDVILYLLKLVLVLIDQKNLISIIKLTHIGVGIMVGLTPEEEIFIFTTKWCGCLLPNKKL